MKIAHLLLSTCALALATSTLAHKQLSINKCSKAGCEKMQVDLALNASRGQEHIDAQGDKLVLRNTGSPRLYLAKDGKYFKFSDFVGQEFSFDIELSNLIAGTNSALYFVDMTTGSPAAGDGYCDAPGVDGSKPCHEMDIWEGNTISNALTSHSCDAKGCDRDGCGINSVKTKPESYGLGKAIDTSKPFTVVTQFVGDGQLSSIKRLYRQNGKEVDGGSVGSCDRNGGFGTMSGKLKEGMVVAISIWNADANTTQMEWLDNQRAGEEKAMKQAVATLSNIGFGPIGSSKGGASGGGGNATAVPTTTAPVNSNAPGTPVPTGSSGQVTSAPPSHDVHITASPTASQQKGKPGPPQATVAPPKIDTNLDQYSPMPNYCHEARQLSPQEQEKCSGKALNRNTPNPAVQIGNNAQHKMFRQ